MASYTETTRRKKDALKYLNELLSIKEYGVQKYNFDWCLRKAGEKFYYSHNTMRMISYDPSIQRMIDQDKKTNKQGELFSE